VTDHPGDPAKKTPLCLAKQGTNIPDPHNPGHVLWWECLNLKEVGGGFEGERYRCDVCGESYFLDYEDMK
jgi:hypothetical protein